MEINENNICCRGIEPKNIPSLRKNLDMNWGRYVDMRKTSEFNSEDLRIWTYLLQFISNFIQKFGLLSGSMPLQHILFSLISICYNTSNRMNVTFEVPFFGNSGCVNDLNNFCACLFHPSSPHNLVSINDSLKAINMTNPSIMNNPN